MRPTTAMAERERTMVRSNMLRQPWLSWSEVVSVNSLYGILWNSVNSVNFEIRRDLFYRINSIFFSFFRRFCPPPVPKMQITSTVLWIIVGPLSTRSQCQIHKQRQRHNKFHKECVNVFRLKYPGIMYIDWNILWIMTPTVHRRRQRHNQNA